MPSFVRPLILATLVAPIGAIAQSACKPDKDARESKLMAYFAAPIAFSPAGTIGPLAKGQVRLSFDATYIPTPGDDISRPEDCYNNSKTENAGLSNVFPRPRLAIGLSDQVYVEASYLPPVTVMDATPNLFSVALGWARTLGRNMVALRAHATVGQVEGPITCGPDAIQLSNPTGVCYANKPSEDTYKPNMFGAELAGGRNFTDRTSGYVGVGVTSLRPRFQVGFLDAANNLDNQKVEVDLVRVSAFGGGRLRVGPQAALTAEVYSVPQDVTTIRIGASYLLGGRR
jgi:hypothetical protein